MITNEDEEHCSPKELANEILVHCLETAVDMWKDKNSHVIEAMTERELALLNDQLRKQSHRCFKLLGVPREEMG